MTRERRRLGRRRERTYTGGMGAGPRWRRGRPSSGATVAIIVVLLIVVAVLVVLLLNNNDNTGSGTPAPSIPSTSALASFIRASVP
jgi:hypothetical protein